MKQNRYEEGRFSSEGRGLGTVTEAMVRERAADIAQINGRPRDKVLDSDLDEAHRELTGEHGLDPEPTPAEQLSEEERWDPVAGSKPEDVETVAAPDEQTFAEKLVEEGVEDAEHTQMLEAVREADRRDKET